MPRSRLLLPLALLASVLLAWPAAADDDRPAYPPTKRGGTSYGLHGNTIPDPYMWLEDDANKEVEAWDNAQWQVMRRRLDAFEDRESLRSTLKAEFDLGGMKSLPTFEGGMRWFTYRGKGADHAILYRTDAEGGQQPQVILNPNGWSSDRTAGLRGWYPSPDGRYVAYRRDVEGSEDTTLYVKDTNTGAALPEFIDRTKFSSVVWLEDSSGFFYSRLPDKGSVPRGQAQYHRRLYFHKIGTLVLDDPMVYGRGRPMLETFRLYKSADRKQLLLRRGLPYGALETFQCTWAEGRLTLEPLIEKKDERSFVDVVGSTYIVDTDRNHGRREVFTAERGDKGELTGFEAVSLPRGPKGVIRDTVVVGNQLIVVHVTEDLVSKLYVRNIAGGPTTEVPLPEAGTVGERIATQEDSTGFWFTFQSHARPPTVYFCDATSQRKPTIKEEASMPTSIDTAKLVSTRHRYKSKDGTEIPIFLLHRKDVKPDGTQPVILYGYGGFRRGQYPTFSRTRALWADLGGVYAIASIRGGDEFGEAWHAAGSLGEKQNVFDDFIAAADWLVETKRASRSRLAIEGRSNGGLLVAACLNQRPDLCRAALCGVPLTDMLRFHHFQYAKSWTKEYGDPDVSEEFAWLRLYSPYHNVRPAQAYPAVLVTAGLKDGRVNAFHARKIVARWQESSISTHPILLRLDRKAGHRAAGLRHRIAQVLDEWCFLYMELDGEE